MPLYLYLAQIDVTPLLTRWGPWGVVLTAVGFFIWKWLLPLVDKYIAQRALDRQKEREIVRLRDEKFVAMIGENLERAEKSRDAERDKFIGVLDSSLRQQTTAMTDLARVVNESIQKRRGHNE